MNIAIGKQTFGRNSRYVFGGLIAGLAAAAIVAGVAVWQTSSGPTRTAFDPSVLASAPVVVPSEPAAKAVAPVHYYLVDSEAQIDGLNQAAFEADQNSAGSTSSASTYVIDLRIPESQQLARAVQEDLYVASTTPGAVFDASLVQVHDLTAGPLGPITSTRGGDLAPAAPSLPKLYIVGSEAEKLVLLEEADAAAAFEGSELVVPAIIVVDSPEQKLFYDRLLLELAMAPEPFEGIIDLRE